MHVAICIVGFRNPDDIERCLDALALSRYRDFSVVICENGGEAAFAELQKRLPARVAGVQPVGIILAPGNLGFAGGVNTCLRETASADAWWILNPDTAPEPAALAALVRRMEEGGCDAVGGVIRLPTGVVQAYGGVWGRWLARAVSLGYGAPLGAPVSAEQIERRQNYLSGASALISRRFLEAVGPMREDYFLYCEEVEWFFRARRAGMRLGFSPEAVVVHAQGTSTGGAVSPRERSRLSVYLNERNRILLTWDCFPWVTPIAAVFAFALFVLRYGKDGAWRQLGYAASGWWAGVLGERGPPSRLMSQRPAD